MTWKKKEIVPKVNLLKREYSTWKKKKQWQVLMIMY